MDGSSQESKNKAGLSNFQKAERVAGYGMSGYLATQLQAVEPGHYLYLLGAIVLLVVLSGVRDVLTQLLELKYGK